MNLEGNCVIFIVLILIFFYLGKKTRSLEPVRLKKR